MTGQKPIPDEIMREAESLLNRLFHPDLLDGPAEASAKCVACALMARDERAAPAQDVLDFVARWAWKNSGITDGERLSAIRFHPTVRTHAQHLGYTTGDKP